jgi:hypothetical protein
MKRDLLHSFLIDIRESGCGQIPKRKLLWMLGRSNESKTAWATLLEEWKEIGGDIDALHGLVREPYIILTVDPSAKVSEWAQ